MEKIKENAKKDFIEMIKKSWTYEKLTKEEKDNLAIVFFEDVRLEKALKGSYNHRWDILQIVYSSFLKGCGYTDFNWREENKGGF